MLNFINPVDIYNIMKKSLKTILFVIGVLVVVAFIAGFVYVNDSRDVRLEPKASEVDTTTTIDTTTRVDTTTTITGTKCEGNYDDPDDPGFDIIGTYQCKGDDLSVCNNELINVPERYCEKGDCIVCKGSCVDECEVKSNPPFDVCGQISNKIYYCRKPDLNIGYNCKYLLPYYTCPEGQVCRKGECQY